MPHRGHPWTPRRCAVPDLGPPVRSSHRAAMSDASGWETRHRLAAVEVAVIGDGQMAGEGQMARKSLWSVIARDWERRRKQDERQRQVQQWITREMETDARRERQAAHLAAAPPSAPHIRLGQGTSGCGERRRSAPQPVCRLLPEAACSGSGMLARCASIASAVWNLTNRPATRSASASASPACHSGSSTTPDRGRRAGA